jgi:hypothetical protein
MSAFNLRAPRMAGAALLLALVSGQAAAAPAKLSGRVLASSSAPIVIVAVDRQTGRIVHRCFLDRPGEFHMPLDPGRYGLFAYSDENRDGIRNVGDPSSPLYVLAAPVRSGDQLELPPLAIRQDSRGS